MSFLAPLFLFGAFAVAAPVLFHLIRRSPQGKMPFSSLMFLTPSPPRLTRRSRLDHLLLLLLRAAAFCLLVLAFARPFLREAAALNREAADRQRVVVLVDTSASLRRGDLWAQTLAAAEATLTKLRPQDEWAVLAFDQGTRPVVGFAELAALDPGQRPALAMSRLKELTPTWQSTELAEALIEAVGVVNEGADKTEQTARGARRVVLISDLQQGSRIEALTDFEWPRDVELELRTVAIQGGNASVSLLGGDDSPSTSERGDLRVRVTNEADSTGENFQLRWRGDADATDASPIAVYVPPGESRVVRLPKPNDPANQRRVELLGDAQPFDNTLFVATRPVDEVEVFYVGAERTDDATQLRYYAERALAEAPGRSVSVKTIAPDGALPELQPRKTPLVVLGTEAGESQRAGLRAYLESGGTVLSVLTAAGAHETLAMLCGLPAIESTEGVLSDYAMLGQIDWRHPLFAPLAGAQYNDFTKIRFWKYRRLAADLLGEARVVAAFENGDPAVIEKLVGKGRLVVLTAGWQPGDSQLSRSSKFVPLMQSMLALYDPGLFEARSYVVGERVRLPAQPAGATEFNIQQPDGSPITLPADAETFADTAEPGVYALDLPAGRQDFAVNLDPRESRTSPLPVETLEQWGARLTNEERRAQQAEQSRQLRDVELEGRQKLWQWLVVAVLAVLIAETWLAGRLSRPSLNQAEGLAS